MPPAEAFMTEVGTRCEIMTSTGYWSVFGAGDSEPGYEVLCDLAERLFLATAS